MKQWTKNRSGNEHTEKNAIRLGDRFALAPSLIALLFRCMLILFLWVENK